MSGLWERIKHDANDRVPVHLITASLTIYAEGDFSKSDILAKLNNTLEFALNGAEEADLNGMADALDAEGTLISKMRYLNLVESYCIAVELGAITNETVWRNKLGI